MKKHYPHLAIFLTIPLVWGITLSFWFNNVDLSYLKTYINLSEPLQGLNFAKLVRGHVGVQLASYLIFGFKPYGYYLISILLHSIATLCFFGLLNKLNTGSKYNLLLSLAFGVNVSFANTIFEGSFNGYYPLLLVLIILSLYPFLPLLNRSNTIVSWRSVIFSCLFMMIGFLFRETMVVVPLLVGLILVIRSNKLKDILSYSQYLIPFLLVVILYFIVRLKYLGELKSDLTDDAVQARMAFIASNQYLKWFGVSLLNLLRMLSDQVLIFPRWINSGLFVTFFSGLVSLIISVYFFLKVSLKSNKNLTSIAKFGLGWFVGVNLFVSLIVPFPVHSFTTDSYIGDTLSRYNYWGLPGLIILIFAFVNSYPKLTKYIKKLLVIYILTNIILVQIGGLMLYKKKHLPAKDFHQKIVNKYPSFPQKTTIYYNFFGVNNLKDYIGDLTYVFKDALYPNTSFTLETSLSHVQSEYLSKRIDLNDVFAFDLDNNGMVVDKTSKVRQVLTSMFPLELKYENNTSFPTNTFANLDYTLEFSAKARIKKSKSECDPNSTNEIVEYLLEKQNFLLNTKVTSSSNYGDYPKVLFYGSEQFDR